jgi:FKBP-type peptidyl-prolyl cis-trans isomerase SlpA
MSQVKANDRVKVHYTGKLSSGEIFDSSANREPLEFQMGSGQLIPGFENGVMGMSINEKKTIVIPCAEAYGESRPEMVQEVPRTQLPPEIVPEVGMGLSTTTPDGHEIPLVITEVTETTIVVDGNHPLAGKDLTFDLEVVSIND